MMPPTQTQTPTRCRPSELMAPSWSLELAEWPISAVGTSPISASTSVNARPPQRADTEEGGGHYGRDDRHGQPGATGFDVCHEVHEGTGEFGVAGDTLARHVSVAQDQHGDGGQRPRHARGGRNGQGAGEGRMFGGVIVLGPRPLRRFCGRMPRRR